MCRPTTAQKRILKKIAKLDKQCKNRYKETNECIRIKSCCSCDIYKKRGKCWEEIHTIDLENR